MRRVGAHDHTLAVEAKDGLVLVLDRHVGNVVEGVDYAVGEKRRGDDLRFSLPTAISRVDVLKT